MNTRTVPHQVTESFQLTYHQASHVIEASLFGLVKIKELIDCYSAILKHPEFRINDDGIMDFTHATVDVDLNETEIFYHFASGFREKRGEDYQLALVFGDEMTKMLLNFYRLFLARTQIDVAVFDDLEKARAWIEFGRKR